MTMSLTKDQLFALSQLHADMGAGFMKFAEQVHKQEDAIELSRLGNFYNRLAFQELLAANGAKMEDQR